jgi:molybdopterin synthase sulfur carrier subunit
MKVRVKYFTTLRELAGTKEDELDLKDGCRLLALIETVALRYGDEAFAYLHVADGGRIDPSIKFLVNGVDAQRLAGFETALKAGDVVAIIPPVGGG